ncbi:MAG: type II secretion system F family protein [Planctomycetia bacterium]
MFEFIDIEKIIPYAVFAGIAAFAWWLMDMMSSSKPRAMERLDQFTDPVAWRKDLREKRRKKDKVAQVIENAAPKLAKPLQPQSEEDASKLKIKLANAGFRSDTASAVFLSVKFVGLIIGLIIGVPFLLFSAKITQTNIFTALGIAGVLFYLPTIVVSFIASHRRQQIFLGLPDALDLMVVCVEAGLGLDQAMRKVSEEMKKTFPTIAEEFGLANLQIQMGRPRNDVLHELGVRSGVPDLRALAGVLIQADKFGSSIAQALRVQSDSMRTKRRQIAEEKAAKTAVKLIFPLVMFIFPGIFVVLVGPAAVQMVEQMLNSPLGGGK